MQTSTTRSKKILKSFGVAFFWLAVWQVLAICVQSEILVPTPALVLKTWAGLVVSIDFWKACAFSLLRITAGFLLSCFIGVSLGVVCECIPFFGTLLSPILHIIRATPVISFIILALVWIRTDYVPVFISFLMVVPILYAATQTGLRSVDRNLLEMARVFRMKTKTVMKTIYLPTVLPILLSQGTVGLGFAWKSGIAAEVICLPLLSIGLQLKNAKAHIETPAVFAWTATIILLSLLLEWLLRCLSRRYEGRWHV
ncbi:MAG: ABC transporter permease subunit [Clostridia bacterium]|nr:ABC transporter permease subunit [Clostridia bacterium]MBQ7289161.1 ABC transporter permease subunit [Clostridia bacterium]